MEEEGGEEGSEDMEEDMEEDADAARTEATHRVAEAAVFILKNIHTHTPAEPKRKKINKQKIVSQ